MNIMIKFLPLLLLPFLLPCHSFIYKASAMEEVRDWGQGYLIADVRQTDAPSLAYITAYTLSEDETDNEPCIGAGNHNLCKETKRVCASRDLPLHTKIFIEGIGECEILDRMAKRFEGTNRIDLLVGSKEEAKMFGIKKLSIEI